MVTLNGWLRTVPELSRRRIRPVFVVGLPGAGGGDVLASLAQLATMRATAGDEPFAAVPDFRAAERGWDSDRLTEQDARIGWIAAFETALLATGTGDGSGTPDEVGARLAHYSDGNVLRAGFLAAAYPRAKFVVVERDRGDSLAAATSAWESGAAVSHPDLPGWLGPRWSGPLTPGWRALRGLPLGDVVAGQYEAAARVLAEDLASVSQSRVITVEYEQWLADPEAGRAQVAAFLDDAGTHSPQDVVERATQRYRSSVGGAFATILRELRSTLLVSTYQTGKVVAVRSTEQGLNTHFRSFETPMGMAYRGGQLALGTKTQVWDFRNAPGLAARLTPPDAHDAVFVPRATHFTGDVRIHDLAWAGGELWLVATRFSCLATLSSDSSFVPRWKPTFVSALAAEDRCHLNGLCVVDDRPKYVTALGTTDTAGGWRERKADGGVIIDIETDQVIASGLSMPHSPRWYRDQLWVLESGQGGLCKVDRATGAVETVARLPGFTRGLAFAGPLAFVGLSEVREATTFGGLPLTARLEDRQCGVWVVNIDTGATVGFLRFDDLVQEIFDVTLLPGLRFPEIAEPHSDTVANGFVMPPTRA